MGYYRSVKRIRVGSRGCMWGKIEKRARGILKVRGLVLIYRKEGVMTGDEAFHSCVNL